MNKKLGEVRQHPPPPCSYPSRHIYLQSRSKQGPSSTPMSFDREQERVKLVFQEFSRTKHSAVRYLFFSGEIFLFPFRHVLPCILLSSGSAVRCAPPDFPKVDPANFSKADHRIFQHVDHRIFNWRTTGFLTSILPNVKMRPRIFRK